ncbi:MAG TPA: SH3 domain-containing protein, partial [Opitutaceae bacterium]|nr:SH3 domain-containing protein [Opitutaceae bacterium]
TPVPGDAPAGWRRVELGGPFDAFVHSRDLNKGLEIRGGASLVEGPRAGAPVITVADEAEQFDLVGTVGDWVKIRLNKKLTGYIAVGETANLPAPERAAVAPPTRPANPGTPAATGRPAQFAGSSADLPRTFQGQLTSAARPILNPNPPYDYQLTDVNGKRIAYLDMRRVLLNVRLESLAGRAVTVTGTLRNTVDGKDLVVAVETLTAK